MLLPVQFAPRRERTSDGSMAREIPSRIVLSTVLNTRSLISSSGMLSQSLLRQGWGLQILYYIAYFAQENGLNMLKITEDRPRKAGIVLSSMRHWDVDRRMSSARQARQMPFQKLFFMASVAISLIHQRQRCRYGRRRRICLAASHAW